MRDQYPGEGERTGQLPVYLSDDEQQTLVEAPAGNGDDRDVYRASVGDRKGRARVWGAARAVALRTESIATGMNRQVLSYRIELYDSSGSRQAPIPVEMRALSLRGQISEGEHVEAEGTFRRGILIASRATNLSTGAVVGAPPLLKWTLRLGVIALVTVLAFMGSWMWTMYRQTVQQMEIFEQQLIPFQSAPSDLWEEAGTWQV